MANDAGTTVANPFLDIDQSLNSVTFGLNQNLGGWTLTTNSSPQTLTIGGTGSTGVTTYGPQTTTINGPILQGIDATNPLGLRVTNGSTLILAGTTTAITNASTQINLTGGTLVLDNSTTNTASRLATTSGLFFQSGTIEFRGNTAAATAFSVGAITGSTQAGFNTIRVVPNGNQVTANFANGTAGIGFNSRFSTFSTFRYEATSGVLGGAGTTDPRITFTGNPGVGANGLLASATTFPTGTSGTFGFATVSDANGIDFATYGATGIIAAGATKTGATTASLGTTALADRAFYNPAAGDSLTAAITVGSIRITPSAPNLTLAAGAFNILSNAVMYNGIGDFTISGTGLIGASGTRYIYVNNAGAALTTGLAVVNGANPTDAIGAGYLILNGTSVQVQGQAGASSNRFDLEGGITVRGTNANFGFIVAAAGSDSFGAVNFRGAVVEIQGGTNLASGDFTRSLGALDGQVRWEGGNGGFSAFGSNASVNIGGATAPLQWAATNFVTDGYALTFGSTRSNAVLTIQNPLQLDTASTAYQLREIRVTAGVGGDKTVFTGALSGAPIADLVKTGNGVLELAAINTYSGNTLVQAGTLSGTGSIIPSAPVATTSVRVGSGATLAPGTFGATANPGTLTVAERVSVVNGATLRVRVTDATTSNSAGSGTSSGATPLLGTNNGFLNVTGAGNVLNLASGINIMIDGTGTAFNPSTNYSYTVATAPAVAGLSAGTPITTQSQFVSIGFNASNYSLSTDGTQVFLNFTTAAVPEPGTILSLAAAGLGLVRFVRRRRAK